MSAPQMGPRAGAEAASVGAEDGSSSSSSSSSRQLFYSSWKPVPLAGPRAVAIAVAVTVAVAVAVGLAVAVAGGVIELLEACIAGPPPLPPLRTHLRCCPCSSVPPGRGGTAAPRSS